MFQNTKNSKQQGDVGLGAAIAHFVQMGCTISIPLTESQSYDLVVDDGTGLKRVQVKTSKNKIKNGQYEVALRTCGGNQSFNTTKKFDNTAVELLFILVANGDKYCIPSSVIDNKTAIKTCAKYDRYKI